MVHEKFTKRDGKTYGPYLYENKRVNGKIVTRYIGKGKNFGVVGEEPLGKPRERGGFLQGKNVGEKDNLSSRSYGKVFLGILGILFVGLLIFMIYQSSSPTGRVALGFEPIYQEGKPLAGQLRFSLKEGEFVPFDSRVRVSLDGVNKEFKLSELLDSPADEGNYFAEGVELFGSGLGYGAVGEKEIYPDVEFELAIYRLEDSLDAEDRATAKATKEAEKEEKKEEKAEEKEEKAEEKEKQTETVGEQTITNSEKNEDNKNNEKGNSKVTGKIIDNSTEEDIGLEENKESVNAEKDETGEIQERSEGTESEPLPMGQRAITGKITKEELKKIPGGFSVYGTASKGRDYSFTLEEGQKVEFIEGSVKVNGEKAEDSLVRVSKSGDDIIVSTSYSVKEKGYGVDYLGKKIGKTLLIDFSRFEINATKGFLKIELDYFGEKIVSAGRNIETFLLVTAENKTVVVNGTVIANESLSNETMIIPEENVTIVEGELRLIKEVPIVRIAKNGRADLNLNNYFSGASRYEMDISNASVFINGSILSLIPQANFSGARIGLIKAFDSAGNGIESNKFNVLVSLGVLDLKTSRQKIVVGEKVRWKKEVKIENPDNLIIELPPNVENVSVKKISGGEEVDVNADIVGGGISGQVIAEIMLDGDTRFSAWLKNAFRRLSNSLTGRAVDIPPEEIEKNPVEIVLEDSATDYVIEYYTGAPTADEIATADGGKIVTISAADELEYTDIIASSDIGESGVTAEDAGKIKVYWYNYNFTTESFNETKAVSDVENESVLEDTEIEESVVGHELIDEVEIVESNVTEAVRENVAGENATTEGVISNATDADSNKKIKNNKAEVSGGILSGRVVEVPNATNGSNSLLSIISNEVNLTERNLTELELQYGIEGVDYVKDEVPFDYYDLSGNGEIDYLEWVVPHLSDQSYQIVLTTANVSIDDNNNITFEAPGNFSHLTINNGSAPYDTLLGYWSFDVNDTNPNTNKTYDYSQYNNDGTINGTIWNNSAGIPYGGAYEFDGINDYINLGTSILTDNVTTQSIWVKSSHPLANGQYEIVTDLQRTTDMVIYIYNSSGTRINFGHRTASANDGVTCLIDYGADFRDKWNHITAVYNGGSTTAVSSYNIYVNGVNCSVATYNLGGSTASNIIGYDSAVPGGYYNGSIDEVMIFNSSLTAQQVLDIYNNQSARFRTAGVESVQQFNISVGDNAFNVSLDKYQRYDGSNISVRLGEWNYTSHDYNTTDLLTPGGIDSSLVAYYNFDNRSSLGENGTHVADRTGHNYNGTVEGASWIGESGVYGGAYEFDALSDNITMSDTGFPIVDSPRTITAWIKMNVLPASGNRFFVNWGTSVTKQRYSIGIGVTNKDLVVVDGSGAGIYTTPSVFTAGKWTSVAVTYDGYSGGTTDHKLYMDGVLVKTGTFGYALETTLLGTAYIGNTPLGTQSPEATIDEVMIFNRSLSAKEIQDLYIKGRALWNYTAWQNISRIDANDNSSRNQFNISTTTTNILPEFELLSGGYQWYSPVIGASATSAMTNLSASIMVPDEVAPLVTIKSPENASYGLSHLPLNFTTTLNENGSVQYSLDSGTNNITMSGNESYLFGTWFNASNGSLITGDYVFSAYGNDTAGNKNYSVTRTFSFDGTAPAINLVYPSNNSLFNEQIVTINYTLSDDGTLSNCWYTNSSGAFNYTITCGSNLTTLEWGSGLNTIRIYANDTANNVNSSSVNFTIQLDNVAPNVTIVSPLNITYNASSFPLNFTITIDENGSAMYTLDDGVNNITMSGNESQIWGTSFNASNASLDDGNYIFRAIANDTAGNFNRTQNVTFSVDTTAPNLTFAGVTEANGTTLTRSNIHVNISFNDSDSQTSAEVYLYDYNSSTFSLINQTAMAVMQLLNFTGLSDGEYYFNASANDTSFNYNTTVTRNLLIDSANPQISYGVGTEADGANISSGAVYVNVTANDSNLNAINFTLWNGSGLVDNSTLFIGTSQLHINFTTLSDGNYTYNVSVNDSAGNVNSTATRTIRLDRTAAGIQLLNPGDGVSYTASSQAVTFQYNVTETGSGITYCNLTAGGSIINTTLTGTSLGAGYSVNTSADGVNSFVNSFASGSSYTWSIRCFDYAGNSNVSDSRSFSVTAPATTTSSSSTSSSSSGGGSGGGGGGGGSVAARPTISVTPDGISAFAVTNSMDTQSLRITNLKDGTIAVDIRPSKTIEDLVSVERRVILGPGESKSIDVGIEAGDKGLITGQIVLSTLEFSKVIPVIINVQTEGFLFDVAVSVPDDYRELSRGDKLRTQVNLLEVGLKQKVDVTANYMIKNFEGDVFLEESETFFVLGAKDFVKEFSTDKLPPGKYAIGVELVYPGAFATSSSQFEIRGISSEINMIIIVGAIAAVVVLGLVLFITKGKLFRRRHKRGK